MNKKIGRNDPCPCGSGKKYKHCHMLKEAETAAAKYTPSGKRKFKAKVLKLDKNLHVFARPSNEPENLKFHMTDEDFRVKEEAGEEGFNKRVVEEEPEVREPQPPSEGESYKPSTEDYRKKND